MPETISPVLATRYFGSSRTYRFLCLCLVLAFYYLSYRYPLQINNSSTSPTYVDTPFLLQIGKYISLLCLCLWFILGECRLRILKRDIPIFVATSFFVCSSPLVAVIAAPHVAEPLFLWEWVGGDLLLVVPLLSMGYGTRVLPTGYGTRDHIDTIVRLIWVFLSLSMVWLVLQVVLFMTIGRLPALAYHNSLSVRFGSIWDDPNAFPMMLAVFVPLVLFRFRSIAALSSNGRWCRSCHCCGPIDHMCDIGCHMFHSRVSSSIIRSHICGWPSNKGVRNSGGVIAYYCCCRYRRTHVHRCRVATRKDAKHYSASIGLREAGRRASAVVPWYCTNGCDWRVWVAKFAN